VSGRRRRWLLRTAGFGVFAVFAFPVYWMVLTSFRRERDVRSVDVDVLPSAFTLENYRSVFERDFFTDAIQTSLVVTALTVTGALLLAFLAALALSRFRFRGRKAFIVAVLMIQMVPS
jgi:N,N'-diacetylchitobiose transport system permease protein